MRDSEIVVLPAVFGFITLMVWLSSRHKLRMERLKLMQKAIDSGSLDDGTRRTILDALANDQQRSGVWMTALGQHLAFLARNLVFVGGWITMFVGGAVCLVNTTIQHCPGNAESGLIAACVGLGLVSVPLAMRELERRQTQRT